MTLEESGCVIHAVGVTRRYRAKGTQAVDTTGAGDAFTATFAAGAPDADAIYSYEGTGEINTLIVGGAITGTSASA